MVEGGQKGERDGGPQSWAGREEPMVLKEKEAKQWLETATDHG
jgi:hypothetical protein